MTDLKDQLIRLGEERPDLRNHLRPILDTITAKKPSRNLQARRDVYYDIVIDAVYKSGDPYSLKEGLRSEITSAIQRESLLTPTGTEEVGSMGVDVFEIEHGPFSDEGIHIQAKISVAYYEDSIDGGILPANLRSEVRNRVGRGMLTSTGDEVHEWSVDVRGK